MNSSYATQVTTMQCLFLTQKLLSIRLRKRDIDVYQDTIGSNFHVAVFPLAAQVAEREKKTFLVMQLTAWP